MLSHKLTTVITLRRRLRDRLRVTGSNSSSFDQGTDRLESYLVKDQCRLKLIFNGVRILSLKEDVSLTIKI